MTEYIGKIDRTEPPEVIAYNAAIDRDNNKNPITETKLRGLGVYTEVRFLRGQLYDDAEFQSLRGTHMIHVSKNSENGKILVGASGIGCKPGGSGRADNRYFLLETTPKDGFLTEFYNNVKKSISDSMELLDAENFTKFFEIQEKIYSKELLRGIKSDIDLLTPSGLVPIYYTPRNGGLALLEDVILSGTVKSATYSFMDISQNKIRRYDEEPGLPKPQVVFLYGVQENSIPTHETEDFIKELKNPKSKEQPKKKSPINRFLRF